MSLSCKTLIENNDNLQRNLNINNDKIYLIVHTGDTNEATIAIKRKIPTGVVMFFLSKMFIIFRPWTTIDYFTVLVFLPAVLSNRNYHWRSPPESSSNSQTCRHGLQLKEIQEGAFHHAVFNVSYK